jgi:hypothetical protein
MRFIDHGQSTYLRVVAYKLRIASFARQVSPSTADPTFNGTRSRRNRKGMYDLRIRHHYQ